MNLAVKLSLFSAFLLASSSAFAQEVPSSSADPSPVPATGAAVFFDATDPTVRPASWSETDPVPLGYHTEKRKQNGLVAGGVAIFTLSYGASVAVGVIADAALVNANHTSSDEWGCTPQCSLAPTIPLYLPAVGPFIMAGELRGPAGATLVLALDGAAQIGGIAMIAYGLAVPKKVLVRDKVASDFTLTAAPMLGNGRTGLGLVGTF
jgi:hypothetical protein